MNKAILFVWLIGSSVSGSVTASDEVAFGFSGQLIQPQTENGDWLSLGTSVGLVVRASVGHYMKIMGSVEAFKDDKTMRPLISLGPSWSLGPVLSLGGSGAVRFNSHLDRVEALSAVIVPALKVGSRTNLAFPCGHVWLLEPETEINFVSVKLLVWF